MRSHLNLHELFMDVYSKFSIVLLSSNPTPKKEGKCSMKSDPCSCVVYRVGYAFVVP